MDAAHHRCGRPHPRAGASALQNHALGVSHGRRDTGVIAILNTAESLHAVTWGNTRMLPEHQSILRLVVAAVLGSIVGIERERLNWVAGLRTHMLVCVGSALFMIVSFCGFADVLGQEHIG